MIFFSLIAAAAVIVADTGAATEYLDRYRELMALAPLRERRADVQQLVLRRDVAEVRLSSGVLYLLSPVGGRTVGAVFRGGGRFVLTPPFPAERAALRRALDVEAIDDSITEVILIFSDSTPNELRGLDFQAGDEVPGDLRGHVHDLVESLRGEKDGAFNGDVMRALLDDQPNGFFLAHITRLKGPPLLFQFDPAVIEPVQLYRPASERRWGANWRVITQFPAAQPLPGIRGQWHFRQQLAVPHYGLEVWLKPTGTADLDFAASARMTLRADEATPKWLRFGLDSELEIDSARWANGSPATAFKAKDDHELWVRMPQRLAAGDSAILQVFYHGNLIDRFEDWFFINPAADWYPNNRQGDAAAALREAKSAAELKRSPPRLALRGPTGSQVKRCFSRTHWGLV